MLPSFALPQTTLRPLLVAITLATTVAAPGAAVVQCVFDSAGLATALEEAEDNGEDDTLLLVEGVFTAPIAGFVYQSSEGKSLTLIGGYWDLGFSCMKFASNPGQTILDASDLAPALVMIDTSQSASGTPLYQLDDLVFADGDSGWSFDNVDAAISHQLVVESTIHRGLAFRSFFARIRGTTRFWNNLIVDNGTAATPAGSGGVLRLQQAASSAVFTHNTVSRNRFEFPGAAIKVLCDGGAAIVDVTNNIVRDNGTITADIDVQDGCDFSLSFNSYANLVGTPDASCCNTNLLPQFADAAAGDYRLRWSSALRNIGDLTPEGGLPTQDIGGWPRPEGLLPDLGAWEFPWVFADGFETGNTSGWSSTVP